MNSSEVDQSVIERITKLLPEKPVDVRTTFQLQRYNCFAAVLYSLGVEGFDFAMEVLLPGTGMLAIPAKGMVFFDREGLEKIGFREVEQFEEKGSKGLVLLESSLGQRYSHAAVYVGSGAGHDFYFHKPLPCIPDIKPLETLLEACSYAEGRRQRAEVTYSFWQLGVKEDSALVESTTQKVYNVQVEEKKDPRANIVRGHDLTETVVYHQDKAVAIVSKCLWNGTPVYSVVAQGPDGQYAEWHEDVEHGDWPSARIVQKSRLESLDRHNPHCIPSLQVLGKSKKEVDCVLEELGQFSYHVEASNMNFIENPRGLMNGQ